MKGKLLPTVIILIIILVGPLFIPICSSCNNPQEYYFENINVLVVGRCRTIYNDGSWPGGLFVGEQSHPIVETINGPLERLLVIVYNTSVLHPWMTFPCVTRGWVGMRNATGVFFWGAKGFGISIFPPIIYIRCHAEKVWVSIYNT